MSVGLAVLLILAGCSEDGARVSPRATRGTPDEQAAIRLAYSEVQTMIFCAGPPAERANLFPAVEVRLREVRLLARRRGVAALVNRTQEEWLQSIATADIACPQDAEERIAMELARLEALIRQLPVVVPGG